MMKYCKETRFSKKKKKSAGQTSGYVGIMKEASIEGTTHT